MCKGILERQRECTQMAHNCRVITNILKTAVGGWKVGSLCVKCGFLEVAATQMEFKMSLFVKKIFIKIYQVR